MPETRPEIRTAREPLTPTEFKRALERGLGRAILCLQKHDPAPYKKIVLEACLKDMRFDAECEGSRVPYLLEAIELIGDVTSFEQRILKAYPSVPNAIPEFHENTWLERQLIEFALAFAQRGNMEARALLFNGFLQNPEYDERFSLGQDEAIIALDGFQGLRVVLEQYALQAKTDAKFKMDTWLLDGLISSQGAERVQSYLRQLCVESNDIKLLIDRSELLQTETRKTVRAQRRKRPEVTYESLQAWIAKKPSHFGYANNWARFARKEQLLQAARDLTLQTDAGLLSGYLKVFRSKTFPLSVKHLVKLAHHENADVQEAALVAMKHIQHPAVRLLALEPRPNFLLQVEAIGMLESNYELGDSEIILQTLHESAETTAVDEESSPERLIHWFGYRVLSIYRKNRVSEALEPLTAFYELNPCSVCREDAVTLLHNIGALPHWMLEETAWDSYEDTRTNARAWTTAA